METRKLDRPGVHLERNNYASRQDTRTEEGQDRQQEEAP
jgi:hypothetical protein